MTSDKLLTQVTPGDNDQRIRQTDRRQNIERRQKKDPDYEGPFRRMEPDRRMRILDRRDKYRVPGEETRFELKVL